MIEIAADQRMALLRSFHAGPHSDLTQKLLNEVAAARLTLLKPDRRQSYNEMLRRRLEKAQPREEQEAPPAKPAPAPAAAEPHQNLTRYYEQLRQHVGEEPPPRSANDDLLETLVPVESPPNDDLELVKPVRPINPAPRSMPVAAPPKIEAVPAPAPPKIEAIASTAAAKPTVARDHDLRPAPKPTAKQAAMPAPRSQPDRSIALPPRSAAWDQAIEEACATESELSHRRRERWKVSGEFIQLVVGLFIIAGLLYGGIKGFTKWQEAEARRTAVAMHDVRRPLSPPDVEPDTHTTEMQPAHTEPADQPHIDSAASQPVPSEPNDPSLKDARSVAGGFGLPDPPASTDTQPRPIVRVPPPTAEERRKSTEAVTEEIKTDVRRVATASGQSELAHKLADKANETSDDPAKRYALATRALELAVKLCDVRLASDLVGGFSTFYDLDSWALRAKTLQRLAQSARNRETREVIAEAALNLVEPALADDHYDSALELATMSMNLATALRNITLRDQAREAVDRLKQIQRWLRPVEDAKYQLEANPADVAANLVIGEFKSLMKRDWQGALINLRAADDKELCALAEREQLPPTPPVQQVALADAWWNLANARQGESELLASKAMRARAIHWYREALPGLTGDSLAVAKKRIEMQ